MKFKLALLASIVAGSVSLFAMNLSNEDKAWLRSPFDEVNETIDIGALCVTATTTQKKAENKKKRNISALVAIPFKLERKEVILGRENKFKNKSK